MKTNKCYFCGSLNHKKDTHHCAECNAISCSKHIYQWVDESNISISKYQPELCLLCYTARYPREGGAFQIRQIEEYKQLNYETNK